MNKSLILIGGGGHARVLLDMLLLNGEDIIGYTDLEEQPGLGIDFLGTDSVIDNYSPQEVVLVSGMGSVRLSTKRQEIFETFKARGYSFESVIHPQAIISSRAILGEGVQIMAGAVVNTGVQIGKNCIINTKASVDHDCHIGAHTHIAPGVTFSGEVTVGEGCHIGTSVSIIQRITIGDNILVPAGKIVKANLLESIETGSKQ